MKGDGCLCDTPSAREFAASLINHGVNSVVRRRRRVRAPERDAAHLWRVVDASRRPVGFVPIGPTAISYFISPHKAPPHWILVIIPASALTLKLVSIQPFKPAG